MSSTRQTTLEDLYPDALLKIVEYLSPTWIINLWRTGSLPLRTSLAKRGALISLTLRHPGGPTSTSRLPGMIASFESLTRLTIHAPKYRIAHPHRLWSCLSKLSQLKTLVLDFDEVDKWMFFAGSADVEFTSLFHEENVASSLEESSNRKMRSLATTYMYLETLSITDRSAGLFQNEHVSQLPSSLISLTLLNGGAVNEGCIEYASSLPRLAELHFSAPSLTKLSKPLPSSLISLTIVDSGSVEFNRSCWTSCRMQSLSVRLNPSSIADLPTSITKLWVHTNDSPSPSFAHLPSLTSLSLTHTSQVGSFVMPSFASPLQTLDLGFENSTVGLRFESATSTVNTLSMAWDTASNSLTIFKYIGCFTQLTSLSLRTSGASDVNCFQYLPPSLISLKLSLAIIEDTLCIDEAIGALPRGLKVLDFPNFAARMSSPFFRLLPRSLVKLRLFVSIPSDLTEEEAANHFAELPRSLRHLGVVPSKQTPNVPWTAAMVRNLPDLEIFTTETFRTTIWTEEMVSSLPRSLREWTLGSTEMASSSFKSLPDLSFLSYGQRDAYLNDENARDKNFDWRGEHFSMLPRSLSSLIICEAYGIENEHLALLPPNLLSFFTFKAPELTNDALQHAPIHCSIQGTGYAPYYAQYRLSVRLKEEPLQDPDPRVLGRPFNWN